MTSYKIMILVGVQLFIMKGSAHHPMLVTTEELENHISLDDLREFLNLRDDDNSSMSTPQLDADYASYQEKPSRLPVPNYVDCFGLGSLGQKLTWIFNFKPDTSDTVDTHFYFSSRRQPIRVQVYPEQQFGLEWVDFNPTRKTIMIVHGFMSHSNASWVNDMTKAFLDWADVNVIAVDWSKGGNTWKYWRAVANTRRVGFDVTGFLKQLIRTTGARTKDMHFVGHSLGAHICSYVSYHLGRVFRITGLDPAQPCFQTLNRTERLDSTDADFVDVIHTNGRLLKRIGFGLPTPIGHADFYPNGGMKQPGCFNGTNSIWSKILPISPASAYDLQNNMAYFLFSLSVSKVLTTRSELQQAICSHGRAYLLFTESLINNNCSFKAYRWNLTYEGVNSSLIGACTRLGSCTEMGIKAVGMNGTQRAWGPYFVLTTEKEPYCPNDFERQHPEPELLRDLRQGFLIDPSDKTTTTVEPDYADPMIEDRALDVETTTQLSWWRRLFRLSKT